MKEFKIGGKITLEDGMQYRIVDIIKENDIEYYFCCTIEKNLKPKVLEKKEIDGKVFMRDIDDPEILQKIASKILHQ